MLLMKQFHNRFVEQRKRMKKLLTLTVLALLVALSVQADDRKRQKTNDRSHSRESHNYIIERQQAYQVQGVPTSRLIIGKREVDIYPNGLMFEKNNLVGVRSR